MRMVASRVMSCVPFQPTFPWFWVQMDEGAGVDADKNN